jgi:cytochrome c peroxidase
MNVAWLSRFLWDGRADVIWAQPLAAMESPTEMNFTRLELAHRIKNSYAERYEPLFGPLPALDDTARFPPTGKPGDPSYDGMKAEDQEAVTRIAVNVSKSIEAYLRKLAAGPSNFDGYVAGDRSALTARQQEGMRAFVEAGCTSCHSGPLFTDQKFHNLGVPALDGSPPDEGRSAGIALERAQSFSPWSAYSDAPRAMEIADPTPADVGAFRTPSLRNVAASGPYMHNGQFATLREVVDFLLEGGGRGKDGFVGEVDPLLVVHPISDEERDAIVDFLGALKGKYAPLPWSDWPNKP